MKRANRFYGNLHESIFAVRGDTMILDNASSARNPDGGEDKEIMRGWIRQCAARQCRN